MASEDIGLSDPRALPLAVAAWDAYERLGLPEGALALAEAAVYLATCPKSDALYAAYGQACRDVHDQPSHPVPLAIRNPVTGLMKNLGYGEGYQHAHDHEGAVVSEEFLPEALRGTVYYTPSPFGFEKDVRRRMDYFDRLRQEARREREPDRPGPGPAGTGANDGGPGFD